MLRSQARTLQGLHTIDVGQQQQPEEAAGPPASPDCMSIQPSGPDVTSSAADSTDGKVPQLVDLPTPLTPESQDYLLCAFPNIILATEIIYTTT